jgi:Co/Zn/Cd efflux system component
MGGAWRGLDWTVAGLVLLMLALTLYAGAVVLPAAHAAREAARAATGDPAAAMGFARLHRLSSILNVIVMLSGILVVVIETVRRR